MQFSSLLKTSTILLATAMLVLAGCGGGGKTAMTPQPPRTGPAVVDTDGDGVADAQDAFPRDASETMDTDGDGVGDNADAFPNLASETMDTDGDGVGDNADAFPNDASRTTQLIDTDGDGVADAQDAFPRDASETMDTDGDGVGDNADAFPQNTWLAELGAGLTVGDNPIYATTAPDTRVARLANPSNNFRVYSASIVKDLSQRTTQISDRYSITSLRSDGNYGLHVTYGDTEGNPTQQEVHFPATSLDNDGAGPSFHLDEYGYWLWAVSSIPFNGMNYASVDNNYVAAIGSHGIGNSFHMALYGLETPNNALPTGRATYSGAGLVYMYDDLAGSNSDGVARTGFNFDTTLEVDFADNSLTGRLDMTQIRYRGGSPSASIVPLTGTGFDITGGITGNGQFTAALTGTDDDPARPLGVSMRGFEGNAVGAFYGPTAEQAGGVFTAERNRGQQVMSGIFAGAR